MTKSVTDPVNATKLAALGAVGISALLLFLTFDAKGSFKQFRWYCIAVAAFIAAMLNASLASEAPLVQNIYGVFGRNSGFLAYFALAGLSLGALLIRDQVHFKRAIWGLQAVGVVNVLYCAWVLAFGDFIGWTNPYGEILGVFGNPNFIGAFLGMFITSLLAILMSSGVSWLYRLIAIALAAVAFYEILESKAIQGIVVTAAGAAIVGFFWIRSYFKAVWVTYFYLIGTSILGGISLLGALQKGPFSFIYKGSVSLRGSYWDAGLTMGKEHPFTGVGMDTYGDFYRSARSLKAATTTPGPNTVTNAAHNVVIDFFASGGWPLLLAYVFVLGFGVWAILRVTLRNSQYDSTFVALAAVWACYQLQSIISINQMGLAVWGWLFTGLLLAYEYTTRTGSGSPETSATATKRSSKQRTQTEGAISPALVGGIGLVIGLIISVPPLSADIKWKSAILSQDVAKVETVLIPGYLNPSSSHRYATATQLFAENNLTAQALSAAREGVAFNKNNFNAWLLLWYMPGITAEEKAEALANLKRLDPLNPNPTSK